MLLVSLVALLLYNVVYINGKEFLVGTQTCSPSLECEKGNWECLADPGDPTPCYYTEVDGPAPAPVDLPATPSPTGSPVYAECDDCLPSFVGVCGVNYGPTPSPETCTTGNPSTPTSEIYDPSLTPIAECDSPTPSKNICIDSIADGCNLYENCGPTPSPAACNGKCYNVKESRECTTPTPSPGPTACPGILCYHHDTTVKGNQICVAQHPSISGCETDGDCTGPNYYCWTKEGGPAPGPAPTPSGFNGVCAKVTFVNKDWDP